jgi:hypothetical protein
MARPRTPLTTVYDPKPRLVTIYKLKPYPQIVQQYYEYVFGPRDEVVSADCPGCGKHLRYNANQHHCKGTLLPMPIKDIKMNGNITKPEQLQEYLTTLKHKVLLSD